MNLPNLAKAGCIWLIFTLLGIISHAQIHANFNSNPTSGCSPLVVSFHDLSTGNPTAWKWDLGNGVISTDINPSTTYFNPGTYTIKLIVRNASGTDSLIRAQYITVYANPVISFVASAYTGCVPTNIHFTDQSTAGSGVINSWQWDFGDGTFSTQQNPNHTYTTNSSFNISLMAVNSHGCMTSATQTHLINISAKPVANFTNSSVANCGAPFTVSFTNQSTGSGILNYIWDFGDGYSSSLPNPSHTYLSNGSFNIRLIAVNQNGCSDTLIRNNAITIAAHQTGFSSPDSVCINTPVSIINNSTPVPVNTNWNFGDGTTSTLFNPVKSYSSAGIYQIKLIGNYGACIDSAIKNIVVKSNPVANFNATPTSSCHAPLIVQFTNNSTDAVTYHWNFGDNDSSVNENPSHTYLNPGNFSVTLTATGSNGCSDTKTAAQYINIVLPVVSINQLPQSGCAPFTWTFQHQFTGGDSIVNYEWDFGDGSSSSEQNPTHVFAAGNYNIKLIVTTLSGCTDTVVYTNGIKAGVRPIVDFVATPTTVCAYLPVVFTDLTTPVDSSDQWLWDFGDGTTSTAHNPQHIYSDTGHMTITLVAFDNGCADTLIKEDYVYIAPPIANFTVGMSCSDKLKRVFTDRSIGADTWYWQFGDGTTSTDSSPVHHYTTSGTYDVSLTVHNNTTGCDFTKTTTITVIDQSPDFVATDTIICRGNSVGFSVTGVNLSYFASFRWSFGDNTNITGNPVNKTYNNPGYYDIRLISNDRNGCKDTVNKPRYILVKGPTSNFGVTATVTCSNTAVSFIDSSITDGISGIQFWIWNFGDGHIDTVTTSNTTHSYNQSGNYTVTLTVIDSSGCSHQFSRTNLINVNHPSASFTSFDTLSCPNGNITFNNTSTGNGLSYHWNFGDGGVSVATHPAHTFVLNGSYTISLIATDQFGCSDTAVRNNFISIMTPRAHFTVSDTMGTCPPLIVNFTNNSVNSSSVVWNFGDGSSTATDNPSHFYSYAGVFPAQLTITGPGGCTATQTINIVVHGPNGTFQYGGLSGCVPMMVNFSATTVNTSTFIWDFSDGNTQTTSVPAAHHNYDVTGSFLPKLILRDSTGCTVPIMGRDTIKTYGIDCAISFNTQTICDRGNVQFNNNVTTNDPNITYLWNFGDGQTSGLMSPDHHYDTTGLYYPTMVAQSAHGCTDTVRSAVPVKVVKSPRPEIIQTANGCVNLTVRFNGRLLNADTSSIRWNWSFGNGNTSNTITPQAQHFTTAGIYPVILTATNSSGCIGNDTSSVEAYAIPVVDAGTDTLMCKGRGITLHATGANIYSWTPPAGLSCTSCSSPLANPATNTTYFVTGRSIHGCSSSDSVKVYVKNPFRMTTSQKDSLCVGSSIRMTATGANSYVWTPSTGLDNDHIASPTTTPSVSTIYRVIGTDDKHCFQDTAYIPIIVHQIPTVEAGEDKTINVGQTVNLHPVVSEDVNRVLWSPTGSIFMSAPPSITVKPNQTTTYTVQVFNRGGCTATDQVTVNVLCNGANLFIPNTFSPNNDGMNDLFYPRGTGIFTIKKIKVFSRWGEVVFEKNNITANDATKGWDGTFKGMKLNPDVYVYVVDVVCDNDAVLTFKGNVALIR